MGVPTGARVHIEMHEPGADESHVETGLLGRLSSRRIPGGLPGVDVATRLQPDPETAMPVQQHPTRADDDRRTGHVHRIGMLRERFGETVEQLEEPAPTLALALVDRPPGDHLIAHRAPQPAVAPDPLHTDIVHDGNRRPDRAGAARPPIGENSSPPGLQFRCRCADDLFGDRPAPRRLSTMEPTNHFAHHCTPRVLLVIADERLRRISETGLRSAGFSVSAPTDATAAEILADSFEPDVLVVDTTMSGTDGRPVFTRLRERSDRYLLCLDPSGRDRNRIEALWAGADDAVSLPISADELAARCHALLRRPRERQALDDEETPAVISIGPLTVDSGRHEIRLCGDEISATRLEFALLEHLVRHPTEVASRADLLEAVWGADWVGDTHVVDVHLSNLRRKLDQAAPDLRVIHTVRGVGFRLGNDIVEPVIALSA